MQKENLIISLVRFLFLWFKIILLSIKILTKNKNHKFFNLNKFAFEKERFDIYFYFQISFNLYIIVYFNFHY